MYREYFPQLLANSDELKWYELDFINDEIEQLYRISDQSEEVKKSKRFTIIVIIHYILSLGVNILLNGLKLVRTGYILMGGIVLELIFQLISLKLRKNYYIFSRIKITRFLTVYFIYLIILCFPVIGFTPEIFLRTLYVQFLFVNMYYIYFMQFNYVLLVFMPIFNFLSILWVQLNAFTKAPYFLIPELLANFIFQYCIFLIKRNEITYKKKMFLKNISNQYHIEYITKLVDALNSFVISIKENNVLFLNQFGIHFLDKINTQRNSKSRISNNSFQDVRESEILIHDEKNGKDIINNSIEHFFNYLILEQNHEMIEKPIDKMVSLSQIIKEKNRSDSNLTNIFTNIGVFKFNQHKIEKYFEIFIRKVKINEEVLELLIYDISSLKIAEKSKAETKYKQKILAKIAHEFKTPIITIITLIQSLNDHNSICNLEASVKKKLFHVVNLSNYTIYLIQDIIQYVSEISKLKIILSKINLKEILDFCYDVLHTLVDCNENKCNKIETFLEHDERIDHLEVLSEENRLKQILLNLISNSVKFTVSGYIKIKSFINNENNSIIISVEDTGIGIKEEDFHLIFQENIQLNVEKDYNSKGSGLGLGISKSLASSLNHEIKFESNLGKGTTLYLSIPVKKKLKNNNPNDNLPEIKSERLFRNNSLLLNAYKSEKLPEETDHNSNRLTSNFKIDLMNIANTHKKTQHFFNHLKIENLSKENEKVDLGMMNFYFNLNGNDYYLGENCIVVIDDHKLVRVNTINLIKKTLKSMNMNNFCIIEGSDGIDLLNIVRKDENSKIKYIFTDENMEYMNGSEAVKIIRKLEQVNKIKSQTIVSITAFDDAGTRKNILDSGVNSVLSKPFSKTAISEILKKYVD